MASHFQPEAPLPRRGPVILPARKPVVPARRVSLFEREVRVRMSIAAIDVLFRNAAVLSEGEVHGDRYDGSTMLTLDLARASARVSEACDLATARMLEKLLAHDQRVLDIARRVAVIEAEKLAGCALQSIIVELHVHRSGRHFHLDVDVEAFVGEAL